MNESMYFLLKDGDVPASYVCLPEGTFHSNTGCLILIFMVYYKDAYNWVGFHPLYTQNNQGLFHCSPGVFKHSNLPPYL